MHSLEQASNAELLSSLTGLKPAQLLMERFGGLAPLARASLDDLQQLKGIGKGKAAAIRAAFLLAQRLTQEAHRESPVLDTPERIADVLREPNRLYAVEHFQVLCLNTRRRLIAVENIGQGILDQVLVHAREVFAVAIAKRASAIVLAHNHPGGDPSPSEADSAPASWMVLVVLPTPPFWLPTAMTTVFRILSVMFLLLKRVLLALGPTGADRAVGPRGHSGLSHNWPRHAIGPRFRFETGATAFRGPNSHLANGRIHRRPANGRAGPLVNGAA